MMIGSVTSGIIQFYDGVRDQADPRTRHWFLVWDSPVYAWVCSILYLLFVWIGPKIMRDRKPFELRAFMIAYNAFLVGLSVYMVFEICYSAYLSDYNPICQPMPKNFSSPSELRLAKALWWYYISKAIEFMDTVLMVLRKKHSQISFLHVFHHVSMLNIWWHCIFLIPGGQSWFATSANSLVHVVMYSYYLLNLFPSWRKHLWWKKYITRFQLLQFAAILVHTANTYISGCDFPFWSITMLCSYMCLMLTLFTNFYLQTYKISRRHIVETNGKNGHDFNHNTKKVG